MNLINYTSSSKTEDNLADNFNKYTKTLINLKHKFF